jgi:hypothetical protein
MTRYSTTRTLRKLALMLTGVLLGMAVNASLVSAAAPIVEHEFVNDASSTGVLLGAEVLSEAQGGYYFRYGTSEQELEERIPAGEESFPADKSTLAQHLQGLEPDSTYYYRVILTIGGIPTEGPINHFTTQPNTPPLNKQGYPLPDNRVWELVSPAEKYGARIEAITKEGGAIAAAENGTAMTYVANSPTTDAPDGNPSLAYSQIISVRKPQGGWNSRDLASPRAGEPTGLPVGNLGEYYAFTPNLETGILEPIGAPPLAPHEKENTVLIRENLLEPIGAQYTALANENNTPPNTIFGRAVKYIAASNNLEHVILNAGAQLTPTPTGSGLYEWNKKPPYGELVPVSILPNGEFINSTNAKLGDYNENVRNAVSENGERVFWNYQESSLYMREVPQEHTVQLDAPQGVAAPARNEAYFEYATPDGERVYFKDGQRLTPESTATRERPELYEYNTSTGVLIDLTPDPGAVQEGADVRGEVIGATNNGEYLYFVAEGILSKEAPLETSETEPHLYVIHTLGNTRTTTFITTLSNEDEHDWETEQYSNRERDLEGLTSRMSPNGRYLAFMSDQELTGYDNHDAAEPLALDEEVYEYDANHEHVICVSCNPTGARPHGVFDRLQGGEGIGLLVDRPRIWDNRWLAGSIPGWTLRLLDQSDYQSRYLSDSGRLFFNSSDELVPQDTNGKEDVYEYEPDGIEGCEGGQGAAGGCVSLISSGGSPHESAFLDASENGNDAFFLTAATLTHEDKDTSYDVYDAHTCNLEAPCAPAAQVPSPACLGNSACQPNPTGETSNEPPLSSIFEGTGSTPPAEPTVTPKASSPKLTRAQNLKNALRACARKPKHERKPCETQARKQYRASKAIRR